MIFSHTFQALNKAVAERILVLDGSMGSMIQRLGLSEADFRGDRFANHPRELKGCNDALCLTKPQVVRDIHEQYLSVGADIIETCSFNANAVSLADYGLEDFVYEINKAAACIAREMVDKYEGRFVAGSIGPTSKSASISPDVNDPGARAVTFDELAAAYDAQIRGLLDGGADILLFETIFDTLNARAALFAAQTVVEERGECIPIMISLTIAGPSGRLLAGQTVEAFCASVLPFDPWAIGLNCSFGADTLKPYAKAIADFVPCCVSVHPNAGLPNLSGEYDDTPKIMAKALETYMSEGLLNIAGGCCGTTPAHIAAIVETARWHKPRVTGGENAPRKAFYLAGLEVLKIESKFSVTNCGLNEQMAPIDKNLYPLIAIGECTNVAGSRKFLRLIKEENYTAAVNIAREMIESGAKIIDVCMDDALLDAETAMTRFLNTALSDPDVAKTPIMVDSSRWEAVIAGLKCAQGKSLVNSISLKEGEEVFLQKARTARKFGAAVVVMLFDEAGQAASYERKITVARRSYRLLTEDGFPAEDIVFDPNVLSIATGIPEHDVYALDFIRACSWIRENCSGALISGGISNLSFSFRGNTMIREVLHAVFLHHAIKNGLSMAIVNPATLVPYEDLAPDLREAAEDAVLCRRLDAAERLLAFAAQRGDAKAAPSPGKINGTANWRSLCPAERVRHAMLNGADEFVEADVLALAKQTSARAVVEGVLMDSMKEIGALFGAGRLFLPQVVRSARVMKKAVAALEPVMSRDGENSGGSSTSSDLCLNSDVKKPKILLATVKGDVHDIGKNIVGVILACNGYEIIDLGVMVPCETIIETVRVENVDIVGLSGLITPSLDEMITVAKAMKAAGLSVPLLIGGAAASLAHTALKIAPEYGPVVYSQDASQAASSVHSLLADRAERDSFLKDIEEKYQAVRKAYERKRSVRETLTLEAARINRFVSNEVQITPHCQGIITLDDYSLERIIPFIDWNLFFSQWGGQTDEFKGKLRADAEVMLTHITREKLLTLRGVAGLFPATSEDETVTVFHEGRETAFTFPRNLEKKPENSGEKNLCLADFVPKKGWIGLFVLSVGFNVKESVQNTAHLAAGNDDYSRLLLSTFANTLAEAFAEEVHLRVRTEWWGYSMVEKREKPAIEARLSGNYPGLRFGFGYSSCPNHADKRLCFDILHVEEKIGVTLTESFMMIPEASVCGLYVSSPESVYFSAE
ncbi:MAG: methionine synthase [Treponema sp.]|jgi:5-methyltetrahydrofolate--homocysteine methyltransferase|nr:methionine synthase [Treponema sp.]